MKRARHCRGSLILLCSAALALLLCAAVGHADSLNFTQLSFDLDGVWTNNTEWGNVDLTYTGQEPILYFNLAVNGAWQVQNWPVLSHNGVGVDQSLNFGFDLGVSRGTIVSSLNYDYMLTPTLQASMPAGSTPATVSQDYQRNYSGFKDGIIGTLLAPTGPMVGGEVADLNKHAHKDFPKQGCGPIECCPAAVSSSLKFLKKEERIDIDDSKISIAETKKATKWETDGCWIDAGAGHNAWWEDKKEYYKDKVTTKKVTSMEDLISEIDGKQDIEIQMTGHTAALVSITKTKDGKFKITVSHDVKQENNAADCVEEEMDYDPVTGKLNGKVTGTRDFLYAIVECPVPEPPTALTATAVPPLPDGIQIDLSWTAPDPAPASYSIERKDGMSGMWYALATGVTTTTYTDTTGVSDIEYYYRVNAVDSGGIVSGWSNEAHTAISITGPPGKATAPNPPDYSTIVHTDLANLSWTADVGAATHDVWLGTTSGGMTKVSAAQTSTSYAPGALLANTDYYWRIDEKNLLGTTTGDVWTFKTGVGLTVIPIRAANRGILFDENAVVRAWSTTTWHSAGDVIGLSVIPNGGFIFKWWTTNVDGTRSTWDAPPYPAGSDLNMILGRMIPFTEPYHIPTINTNLYAVFVGAQNSLTVTANPPAGGTVTAHNNNWPAATLTEFEVGEVAHLQTTPAAGYLFAGWESDKAGVFADPFAADTTYAMTAEDTAITAYFAHALSNTLATSTQSIAASDLAGTNSSSFGGPVSIGAYGLTNSLLWSRVVCKFPVTIPALSLRNGLGKFTAMHATASSVSGMRTLNVTAYPITTACNASATWLTTDGTALWTTPGGDMGASLGTQPFVNVPVAPGELKTWMLPTGTDYRTLLTNGIECKGDVEGDIAFRKGFGTGSLGPALRFFYDPPTGAGSGVIKDWAYLGFYSQGAAADNALRLDSTDQVSGTYNGVPVTETTIAPKTGTSYGNSYGTYAWAVGSSGTDLVDLLGTQFYGSAKTNGTTYCAVYIHNPGAANAASYLGLGSDDYSRVWTNGVACGTKAVAQANGYDQAFIGPFTLLAGWNRLLVKVENGTSAHGLYARLANADRTAITGLSTMAFATTDATAPTNATSATEAGGAVSGVSQSTVAAPVFTFVGPADPQGTGEGVSGLRGFKVYFGTDPAGVPNVWSNAGTFAPGSQASGTYYLRVKTVDYALNEAAAVADVFMFILAPAAPVASYGLNNKAVRDAIMNTASANMKFTVWGLVTPSDANSFTVDDGSSMPVKVIFAGYGFSNGDYVSATGTLNVSDPENPVLTAEKIEIYP